MILMWFLMVSVCNALPDFKIPLSRGFGKRYEWHTLEEGTALSTLLKKPLMLIVSRDTCLACVHLKTILSDSEEILKLSKNFVMVNIERPDLPSDPKYSPKDNTYVPRILFYDYLGTLQSDIFNIYGLPHQPFFYPRHDHIVYSMQVASQLNDQEKDQKDIEKIVKDEMYKEFKIEM